MFSILVNEKGGESKRLEFDKPEVTIGRVQGNDIILPKGNVSKRHSRIVLKDGKFIIVDLKSTNGTYVNGRKITSPLVVKNTDKIYVGDFILSIDEAGAGAAVEEPAAPPVAAPRPRAAPSISAPPPPPRRLAEDADAGADLDDGGDSTLGQSTDAKDEPPIEAPPPRRPTMQPAAPAPSIRPAPAPAPAPRAADPLRQGSRQDVPVIAPSRPTAPPRPATPAPTASAPPPAAPRPRPVVSPAPAPQPVRRPTAAVASEGGEGGRADGAKRARITEALRSLSARLVASLGSELQSLRGDALRERAEGLATEFLAELAQDTGLPPGIEPDQLLRDAVAEAVGLGPLDELLLDDSVYTITVSRPDRIFVDRSGAVRSLAPRWFSSSDAVQRMLSRIAERSGRSAELTEARLRGGLFETRLDGGFMLSAALGPLASGTVSLVVRRGRRDSSRLADLAQQGVMSVGMAEFLEFAVCSRRNVLVSGVSGSGRSTLVGALLRAADGQRAVLVEEAAELDGGDLPWISLSGAGGDARRAFSSALRMKPERVVVGDVRGAEALDVISALAGGLDGAIFCVTGASARDALGRLASAAKLAPEAPAAHIIDAELGAGVHLLVVLGRGPEGESRVLEISEVNPGAEGPQATPVFSARGDGTAARFTATGHIPVWAEGAPASMFRA